MKIVVLAGGLSTEREVSLSSGIQVCKALIAKGHQAVLLDLFLGYQTEDLEHIFEGEWNLGHFDETIQSVDPDLDAVRRLRGDDGSCLFGPNVIEICRMADMVYMGLHGADGENGKIQAAFDVLGIRYTGSDYLGSALAMDKGMAKKVFLAAGIPTPKGYTVTRDTIRPVPEEIGYPCVVKPCCGGSSVGVSIPENEEEYNKALEEAFSYEDEILVEEFIKGREFSVGVIAGKVLPIIEIIPKEGFYDYKTKYQAGMAQDVCPAELSPQQTEQMQKWALSVYRELKLEVYGRIDFLLKPDGTMYCLEANTLPGMTPISLLPQEALAVGVDYGTLCETVIAEAMKRFTDPSKKKRNNINEKEHFLFQKSDCTSLPVPMKGLTLETVIRATGGTYTGPEEAKSKTLSAITIDSRTIQPGCLFVAIRGNRVDGNTFVPGAYEQEALCCLSEEPAARKDVPYIQVKSCTQALKDMAECYRELCGVKVVGITGSVGKTTTKEMIAGVLSQKYNTLKTLGNFNNEIGLPLTVFRLRPQHEVAVLEMGISDFGEMDRLAKVARPDVCVITNIGQCHLENLGSRDGILKAKTEMFDFAAPDAHVYLNGDDDKLITLTEDPRIHTPEYFSLHANAKVKPYVYSEHICTLGLAGTRFELVTPAGRIEVTVPAPGRHMVSNALAAAAVGLDLGLSLEQIKAGIEAYEPVQGHGHILQSGDLTIMDDCYNANPVSMKAGLDVLAEVEGRSVAILGDMFELGEKQEQMHYEVGVHVAEKKIDVLIAIGTLAKQYVLGAEAVGGSTQCLYFETKKEALDRLGEWIYPGDSVLVKASHAMGFEEIVQRLVKH